MYGWQHIQVMHTSVTVSDASVYPTLPDYCIPHYRRTVTLATTFIGILVDL